MHWVHYVAFLRGINVGGHKQIKMEELKKAFESLGFQNVKTILSSGNVIFDTEDTKREIMSKKIAEALKNIFGYDISIFIRTIRSLQNLATVNPFEGITITSQTRLYITFLSEKLKGTLKIPYESPQKNFMIVKVSPEEVCSVLILSPDIETPQVMSILEKEFGKVITTRNWNTICKIIHASASE